MIFSVSLSKMPPWTNDGGCLAAMCGKECVAIATDYHTGGSNQFAMQDSGFKKVFQVTPRIFLGLTGLQLDILTVRDRTLNRQKLAEVSQCHEMSPQQLSIVVSNMLYKQRSNPYYVESMVAGLQCDLGTETFRPYICQMDWIGYRKESQNYVVAGTCVAQLSGMCASLWKPDLAPDDLFKVISTTLVRALPRDSTTRLASSALVYLIEKDKVTERIVDSSS